MSKFWYLGTIVSAIWLVEISRAIAAETPPASLHQLIPTSTISQLHDFKQPTTEIRVNDRVAQTETVTLQITAVQLQTTSAGLDILLETATGTSIAPQLRQEGTSLIADIPNATLALPENQTFRAENPTADIGLVQVVQDKEQVRVIVTGKEGLPKRAVRLKTGGKVYGLNEAGKEAELEIVVTTEALEGYRVPDASTATRTNTPIRDIPQSIQVVPQQVLRDQGITSFFDALRNVPGVSQSTVSSRGVFENPIIRGFSIRSTLRDGLIDDSSRILGYDAAIVDQIEVLKGPASVLYGQGGLGGTINYITKQPLNEPFYELQGTIGNFDSYRGAIDFSGPLNADKTVLYRFNASVQSSGSFVDFLESQRFVIAPKLTWLISDQTKLTLKFEYIDENRSSFDNGIPAVGSVLPNPLGRIPRNRFLGEPENSSNDARVIRVGYNFEHKFSENWRLQSAFQAAFSRLDRDSVFTNALLPDNRTVTRSFFGQDFEDSYYNFDTYAVGKFATGKIKHQLVAGFSLSRLDTFTFNTTGSAASIDLFNPVYGLPRGTPIPSNVLDFQGNAIGFYIQDQISLLDNLKLLLGGRFDIANQTRNNLLTSVTESQQQEVFTPRVGIVYQPIPAVSLYASYGESFLPTQSAFSTLIPQPERGTQYEIGIKADLNKRLAATLAFYDLARTNVPFNISPIEVIQIGKQRSRGIEFDLSGEILPGWNIFAGYAYTDARIKEDRNPLIVGNVLNNVPEHSFNLWTSYELQSGKFKGLGFGLGLFYAGDRQGDLANSFELPSYLRTDAAIFYRRDRFRVALNFKNLFDVDYAETAFNRTRVSPGEPFTVQGTVSWQF
jgi:iron complex outermembrane receptor protein